MQGNRWLMGQASLWNVESMQRSTTELVHVVLVLNVLSPTVHRTYKPTCMGSNARLQMDGGGHPYQFPFPTNLASKRVGAQIYNILYDQAIKIGLELHLEYIIIMPTTLQFLLWICIAWPGNCQWRSARLIFCIFYRGVWFREIEGQVSCTPSLALLENFA